MALHLHLPVSAASISFEEMDAKTVLSYFDSESVVEAYAQAAARVGLWVSEERLVNRLFEKSDSLLELGCGAGRISFGLHELGYENVLAIDYSKQMIKKARHMGKLLEYSVPFRVCDATDLEFEDSIFDGAIFGFNGLMQIPGASNRRKAFAEIYRVIRPGAWFVFTTHDRSNPKQALFWDEEKKRWENLGVPEGLEDFGDRTEWVDDRAHFMHVPERDEIEAVLQSVGFRLEVAAWRSEIANEPQAVREFSDDCVFWIVQKPDTSAS